LGLSADSTYSSTYRSRWPDLPGIYSTTRCNGDVIERDREYWRRKQVAQVGVDGSARVVRLSQLSTLHNKDQGKEMQKTILITGAGSGFGKLVAFDLARKGHNIIAAVQIWPQVTALKEEAQERGLALQVEKLDVTDTGDRKHIFRHDIDVLLSNAGLMEAGPLRSSRSNDYDQCSRLTSFRALPLRKVSPLAWSRRAAGKLFSFRRWRVYKPFHSQLVTPPANTH
jgi:hypothetical protein